MNLTVFTAGLMLGAGFIVAIGSQNAFVLRQGLQRRHVGAVVLFCAASDAFLILLGTLGVGRVLAAWPWLTPVMSLFGALFLTAYGIRAGRRALRPRHAALYATGSAPLPLRRTLLMAAAFTFLNPHVYLDTVILLGTLASTYHGLDRAIFATGAATASSVWFTALGYGARALAPVFARPVAWRVLDALIALSMLVIAGRLWFAALQAVYV